MGTINKPRVLPEFNIYGTNFLVNVANQEFVERQIPYNTISFKEIGIRDNEPTEFAYDLLTKNVYEGLIDPEQIPDNVRLVVVPSLSFLEETTRQNLDKKISKQVQKTIKNTRRRKGLGR